MGDPDEALCYHLGNHLPRWGPEGASLLLLRSTRVCTFQPPSETPIGRAYLEEGVGGMGLLQPLGEPSHHCSPPQPIP